jgi:hypothetical protein
VCTRQGSRRLASVNSREERIAQNEAMYRAVNRHIEHVAEETGDGPSDELKLICECGQPSCQAMVTLTIAEYDEIHGQRDRFAVVPGHQDPAIERVVRETPTFVVVDKFGQAERVAEGEEDREGTD